MDGAHTITGDIYNVQLLSFFYVCPPLVNFIVEGSPEKLNCECDVDESVATLRESLSTAWRIPHENIVLSYDG